MQDGALGNGGAFVSAPFGRPPGQRTAGQTLKPSSSAASENSDLPAATIRDLAALGFVEGCESVILYGPVGVGKTHVAQALGHLACRRGFSVTFATCSRVLADLSGGRADGSWEARLRRWGRPRVLILDDFALRGFTAAQADDLYELVAERRGGSFILASNRAPADWYGLFPNPVVAEGVLDRLVNSAHHVAMLGRSFRPNQRPGRTPAANPKEASHD